MNDPEAILNAPELTDTLDFSRPVALSIIAVLQFGIDDEKAYDCPALSAPRPPGSYLALSTVTTDSSPAPIGGVVAEYTKARCRPNATLARCGPSSTSGAGDPEVVLVHKCGPSPRAQGAQDQGFGHRDVRGVALKR